MSESQGIDGTPASFLFRYAEWCARYLCLIIEKLLSCAELPNDWKHSRITPILKTRPEPCFFLQPIHLVCTCVKTLEHIFAHTSAFVEENGIVDSQQRGFRRRHSMVTQLLETVHDHAEALDRGSQIGMIFLDFKKTFDHVCHQKLVLKLGPILKNDSLLA